MTPQADPQFDAQLRDASEVARAVMTRCPVPIIALVPTADTGTAGRDLTANGVVDVIPFPVQAATAELASLRALLARVGGTP